MAADTHNDKPQQSVTTCERCGGVSRRIATLPKRVEHAGYEIFQCVTCEAVDWIQRE